MSLGQVRTRRQLSLFVPRSDGRLLESLRQQLDPIQHGLIPAHVTLCREDELEAVTRSELRQRLQQEAASALTLRFGPAELFHEHGVLLNAVEGLDAFHALRVSALGTHAIRSAQAHLTLAHPRNPKAPGNTAESLATVPNSWCFQFPEAALIEQAQGAPWRLLEVFRLGVPGAFIEAP